MSNLNNKNILVTGATGLVGSHLTEKLLFLGANVFTIRRSFDYRSYFALKKLEERVVNIIGDIKDFEKDKKAYVDYLVKV